MQIYREKRQREIFCLMIHSPSIQWPELRRSKARSQELLLGLSRRGMVPKLRAVLDCFLKPQRGSWMGSGVAGIRTGAHMQSWFVQGEDFSC